MKEISIVLPHITLAGLSFGDSSKPMLLALHGWLDNAASFIPLARHLEDFHIIAIDWPGHGQSMHRPEHAHYQLTDYVFDLYALVEHLNTQQQLEKINIIAHSLGGIVGSLFAGTFPEKVNKLVLIESLGPLVGQPEDTADTLRKSIKQHFQIRKKNKPIHLSVDSAVLARTNAGDFSSDIAQLLVERSLMPIDGGYTWRSDQRLRRLSPWRMTEEQAQNVLAKIVAPVLLIVGDKGMDFPIAALKDRGQVISDLTVAYFSGGHHVHMEQPEIMSADIRNFMNE